jgi:hypothetical protein
VTKKLSQTSFELTKYLINKEKAISTTFKYSMLGCTELLSQNNTPHNYTCNIAVSKRICDALNFK